MAHLFSHIDEQGLVGLGVGAPDKSLLKKTADVMLQGTKALLESGDVDCLQYGPRRGDSEMLKELAKFLSDEYQDEVKSENLMINAGATQGLKFLSKSLFDPGDLALFEDPTYFIAITVLVKDIGLKPMAVSTDEDGINVDEVDKILTEHVAGKTLTSNKPYSALVYLVPTFNNPKGTILSEEKSKKLIKVLRKHKAIAICDDVYNTLSFIDERPPLVTPPPKRLFAYDNEADADYQGNVVSNCTFSKTLGPGLRLGWVEAPPHLLTILESSGYVLSGGCFNHYTSCVIREALKLGLISKLVVEVREVYQSRKNALCDAIDKFLPMAQYLRPKGGYFVWVILPENINTNDLFTICKEKYRVLFRPGTLCSCVGNFPNCLRLSFSYYSEEILSEAVRKIRMAIDDLLNYK
ncbi:uncharacterized protein YER152C-like [Actinia tenebrosa]|uniref:Uncharacterized protein YER152C-like n=1 Tax=Actinia tenebrosa TaxID=6105 RepID=A0A6P8IBV4_ACTTE|nr:uncharacterized protein YER152C-like [Actinia tenebrosa]